MPFRNFFSLFFLLGIFLIAQPSVGWSQNNLTQKLLDYNPPMKPTPKPAPPKTGEIEEKELLKYQKIFELQKEAKWQEADLVIQSLKDKRLIGYVLKDRYLHPTAYTSTYEELRSWMNQYADHASANRIYNLAVKKRPANDSSSLKAPETVETTHRYIDITRKSKGLYSEGPVRSEAQKQAFQSLAEEIKNKIRNERPTEAYSLLNGRRSSLTKLDYNRLKSRIAASYMHEGKITKAFELAKETVESAGAKVPLGAWVAGLSAWRKGNFEESAKFFEVAAASEYANAWTRSGGAFWASRAHMRIGNFKAVSLWLNRAASEPRTFYGLIAIRALSRNLDLDWHIPPLGTGQKQLLTKNNAAVRGLALAKLGRFDEAEKEFRFVEKSEDVHVRRAVISVAENIGAAGMSWRGASYLILKDENSVPLAAQYPYSRYKGEGAYKIDSALVHAIMRQESRFNPKAGNPSGASGLMQLLPSTGRGIMGESVVEAAGGDQALFDPEFNLRAGQKYVHELFKSYVPNKNLFDLLIAWNAGPGNLQRWKKNLKNIDDPLLFIETIPVAETRAFVERVMTNYWLYQNRFGRPTPSLDAVAEGKWPIYIGQ